MLSPDQAVAGGSLGGGRAPHWDLPGVSHQRCEMPSRRGHFLNPRIGQLAGRRAGLEGCAFRAILPPPQRRGGTRHRMRLREVTGGLRIPCGGARGSDCYPNEVGGLAAPSQPRRTLSHLLDPWRRPSTSRARPRSSTPPNRSKRRRRRSGWLRKASTRGSPS